MYIDVPFTPAQGRYGLSQTRQINRLGHFAYGLNLSLLSLNYHKLIILGGDDESLNGYPVFVRNKNDNTFSGT